MKDPPRTLRLALPRLTLASMLFMLSSCILFTDLGGYSEPAKTPDDSATPHDGNIATLVPTSDGSTSTNESGAEDGSSVNNNSAYATRIAQDQPIAYYRLDDPVAPVAKDSSGKGHDGVYKGGVALNVAGAIAGNGAAEFDGNDDRFEATLPAAFDFAGKAPFTVEAWVKRTKPTLLGVLSKGVYTGAYQGWFLVYSANNQRIVFFRAQSPQVDAPIPPNDKLVYVVATFDGVTLLLYLDGKQLASDANQKDMTATGAPLIMGNAANWDKFGGVLDEVAIYDKALSPTQIQAHFDAASK